MRSALLVIVVCLHALMAGISVTADGISITNVVEGQAWFVPVSWFVQIMPLFFVLGGFSSHVQWTRMRGRGLSASDYVSARLRRLLVPSLVAIGLTGAVLAGLTMAGVDSDLLATAGYRLSQPLWFLGVYVLCTAFVPVLVAAHEARPTLAIAGLTTIAVAVDVIRGATGVTAVGFLNLLFVWLAIQQLGFWLATGRIDGLSSRARTGIAVSALLAVAYLTVAGPYRGDMFQNLNPPTVCLVVLGVAQVAAFSVLRPRLRRLADAPIASGLIDWIGHRSMTVYLWHMPVIIAVAAALVALATRGVIALPEPLTAGWWSTRPLWLLAVCCAVVVVAAVFARFERGGGAALTVGVGARVRRRTALAVVLGAGAVVVVLVTGFSVLGAATAVVAITWSLALVRSARS